MRRRMLVAGLATAALSGCGSVFGRDIDGDGVGDRNDAAPRDPRASEYVAGDPPPAVALEPVGVDGDAPVDVRLAHEGGDPFTADNTGRLELAVDGTTVATVALPFEVGDRRVVRDVPTGRRVVLLWFPPGDGDAAVVATDRLDE